MDRIDDREAFYEYLKRHSRKVGVCPKCGADMYDDMVDSPDGFGHVVKVCINPKCNYMEVVV